MAVAQLKELVNSFNNAAFKSYYFNWAEGEEYITFIASNFALAGIEKALGKKATLVNGRYKIVL